ncbi:protein of unknown function [Lentzea fradiae]|uniref:DUF397 domain-containing protein n=1 Tax=Lentzea fradiae TaxID=200378 RepID=A0A1G7TDR2_9PSEU|nr:DUF397 domain-containing protein [Lentzea fradiae]SDG33456.1 protein of unknown function [Lentzea fradiae]
MTPQWRKSSYSGGNGQCVEVAWHGAVRDSKNPEGPRLDVGRPALTAFLTAVRSRTLS